MGLGKASCHMRVQLIGDIKVNVEGQVNQSETETGYEMKFQY